MPAASLSAAMRTQVAGGTIFGYRFGMSSLPSAARALAPALLSGGLLLLLLRPARR
jgi:hypothetical protein